MSASVEKLVRMLNQIATEFEHQQGANAADATWDHLWHFWDPRMRETIITYVEQHGAGLTATSEAAVRSLARGLEPAPQTRATEFTTDAEGNTEADAG